MNRRDFMVTTSAVLASAMASADLHALAAGARAALDPDPDTGASPKQLLFGVDYYPDQTPERLWEEDASQMAAAGITNVQPTTSTGCCAVSPSCTATTSR